MPPRVRTALYFVHTDEGLTGLGEGAALDADQLAGYEGRSPFEYITDDGPGPPADRLLRPHGAGGRAAARPSPRTGARHTAPLAWWSHCFPPRGAAEGSGARPGPPGTRVHKFKRRAHTDVVEQVAAIAEAAPRRVRDHRRRQPDFRHSRARPSISGARLRALPTGPLSRVADRPGRHRRVPAGSRRSWGSSSPHHMGSPRGGRGPALRGPTTTSSSAPGQRRRSATPHVCGARDKPFWMQLGNDGTGISTLFMLHLAAAISNAVLRARVDAAPARSIHPERRDRGQGRTGGDSPKPRGWAPPSTWRSSSAYPGVIRGGGDRLAPENPGQKSGAVTKPG